MMVMKLQLVMMTSSEIVTMMFDRTVAVKEYPEIMIVVVVVVVAAAAGVDDDDGVDDDEDKDCPSGGTF